jgi:hypothetical protein
MSEDRWFEKQDHIEAAKNLLSSRMLKFSARTAISIVDQYYTDKSYSRYGWYTAYAMTALASLPILFAGAVGALLYHGAHRVIRGHYSSRFFGVLLDIWADKNTDLSFAQKIAIFAANVLTKGHTDLFKLIQELDSSVDKVLDIAVMKFKEAEKSKVEEKPVQQETGKEFLRKDVLNPLILAAQAALGNETNRNTILTIAQKEKLLDFVPEKFKEIAKVIIKDESILENLNLASSLLNTNEISKAIVDFVLRSAKSVAVEKAEKDPEQAKKDQEFLDNILDKLPQALPEILKLEQIIIAKSDIQYIKAVILAALKEDAKTDDIIQAALPLITSLLSVYDVKNGIHTILKNDAVNAIIIEAYKYTGAEAEEVKFLENILSKVAKDATLIPQVLQLAYIITQADIMPVISAALEKDTKTDDIIQAALPLVTNLLEVDAVKDGISALIQNDAVNAIIIEAYKLSDPKAKPEEITLITEILKGPIAEIIDLCGALLQAISSDDIKSIYDAFNAKETKDFLAGGPKPALPVALITACIPLAQKLLSSPAVVSCIKTIINNQQLDTALKNFLGEDSKAYKHFTWLKGDFDKISSLASELLNGIASEEIGNLLSQVNSYIGDRKSSENKKNVDKNFIIKLFPYIAEDKTNILSTISKSENLTPLVNSYIKSFYSEKVTLVFANLETSISLATPLLKTLNEGQNKFGDLVDVVLENIYKAEAIDAIDKAIESYNRKPVEDTLKKQLAEVLKATGKQSYFKDILNYITEVDKPGKGKYQQKIDDSANIKALAETLNQISGAFANEGRSGEENEAKAAAADDKEFNVILSTVTSVAGAPEFENLCKHLIKDVKIRDSKSHNETTKIARDQQLLEMAQYFFGSDNTYASLPYLLESIQKYEAWKKSGADDKQKSAQECYSSVAGFLTELEAILGNFKNLTDYNEVVADLLHEVIPDNIKYHFTLAGHDVDSLVETVFADTTQVTALLPTIAKAVLGISGVTSAITNTLLSNPLLVVRTLASAAYSATISATDILSPILQSSPAEKTDFKQLVNDYETGDQDESVKLKMRRGNFRGANYGELGFKNLIVTRLEHNCAVSLDRSNISHLKFTDSEISGITAICCTVYNMTIENSTVTNLDFSNTIRETLIIKNSTLDAKTFVSLIKCIEKDQLEIENITIKGSLSFACNGDETLLQKARDLREAYKPAKQKANTTITITPHSGNIGPLARQGTPPTSASTGASTAASIPESNSSPIISGSAQVPEDTRETDIGRGRGYTE